MRPTLNRSFFIGLLVASATWGISLILYWRLTGSESQSLDGTLNPHHSDLFAEKYKQLRPEKKMRLYNEKLIQELQPIHHTDSDLGLVKTVEDEAVRNLGYKTHAFNALVSNHIGLHRELPDTRHPQCLKQRYERDLPQASVILCFYNEQLMTLLRSVNSVLQRTPHFLLKEVILMDDASDLDELQGELEERLKEFGRTVRLLRNDKREGLIRTRVYGARNATGEVLIFLDSHIEVNKGWIEPLLARIKANRTILPMPMIDIINADTFMYTSSPLVRGGFNWGMHFRWINLPPGTLNDSKNFAGPFRSPAMAGGLFAVDRKYFKEMGEYDLGMDVWGGENVEISLRIWMCGGSIELVPCSRVGHVFRKRRPYGDKSDTMLKNSLRLVEVWLDDYKKYFYQQNKGAAGVDFDDINDRLRLRDQQLHCRDFQWYLDNIYPELEIPGRPTKSKSDMPQFQPWHSRKRNYVDHFMLQLHNTSLCIGAKQKDKVNWKRGSALRIDKCTRMKHQIFYETDKSELVLGQLYCLEAPGSASLTAPVLNKCHEQGGDQEWKRRTAAKMNVNVMNLAAGTCLAVREAQSQTIVELAICDAPQSLNKWDLISAY